MMGPKKILLPAVLGVLMLFGCASNKTSEGFFDGLFPPATEITDKAEDPVGGARRELEAEGETTWETEFIAANSLPVGQGGTFLPAVGRSGNGVNLNFLNTDIKAVINAVAGDMLGLTYKIDPAVSGTLTLQSAGPVKEDDVLLILEDALRLQGVAMVDASGMLSFVPMAKAPQQVGTLRVSRTSDSHRPGFGVQAVPLRFTTPSEMQKVLAPFAPEGGILRIDNDRNLLVLAGTSQERALMLQMVDMFDVDWLRGKNFALFRPKFVEAETLASDLRKILEETGGTAADALRLVPIPRINTVLGIAPDIALLRQVDEWVKRLDVARHGKDRKIFVYPVKNVSVEDLAYSLAQVFSDQAVVPGAEGPEGSRGGSPPPAAQRASSAGSSSLRVVPDVANNALLIYATPLEYQLVEETLKQMDVPPRQVLIEATLAEITLNDELRYGVQWFFETGNNSLTLSEATSGLAASQFPGFSYVFDNDDGRRVVLNALSSVTDVNVISSPKIMVLNNQPATIQVGDQVPITVQSAVSVVDPEAPIVNSVQFRDTGVILSVVPHANAHGMVTLEINQEVSDVVPTTTSGIDSPTIQQRRITSTVVLKNGQTVALGGLIRTNLSQTKSGVPLLSKIPLIGGAFRNTDDTERRTELIVLITARVLYDYQETQEVLNYLRDQFVMMGGSK